MLFALLFQIHNSNKKKGHNNCHLMAKCFISVESVLLLLRSVWLLGL